MYVWQEMVTVIPPAPIQHCSTLRLGCHLTFTHFTLQCLAASVLKKLGGEIVNNSVRIWLYYGNICLNNSILMFIFQHCMTSSNSVVEMSTPGWKSVACMLSQPWTLVSLAYCWLIKMVNQTVPVGLHDDLRLVVSCVECHVIIRDLREINLL